MFRDCCDLSEDLSGAAVPASVLADLGIILAAAVAVGSRPAPQRLAASALALVVLVAVALSLVAGMAYAPASPRDASLLDCRTSSGTTLCVWPEHAAEADAILSTVVAVEGRWAAAGSRRRRSSRRPAARRRRPARSRSSQRLGARRRHLRAGGGPCTPAARLRLGLHPRHRGPVDRGLVCGGRRDVTRAAEGGLGSTWGLGGTTLDPLPTVDALWKVSVPARQAWVTHAVSMVTTCDEVAQDLTVHP